MLQLLKLYPFQWLHIALRISCSLYYLNFDTQASYFCYSVISRDGYVVVDDTNRPTLDGDADWHWVVNATSNPPDPDTCKSIPPEQVNYVIHTLIPASLSPLNRWTIHTYVHACQLITRVPHVYKQLLYVVGTLMLQQPHESQLT